jgi:hypothetical protein
MTTDRQPAEQGHCEWCGADFDAGAPAPARPHGRPVPAPVAVGEPATHCEWCGAEYPTPEGGTA